MTGTSATSTAPRRHRPSAVMATCYAIVLALWLLFPFAITGFIAQDAIPYAAAGRLVHSAPREIYAVSTDRVQGVSPAFRSTYCSIAGISGRDCRLDAVGYVATPLALPFAALTTHLSGRSIALVMRFLAALSLVGGMWLIWKRLAHRTPLAPLLLVTTAMLLTPMAMVPIKFAQTSPLLFLSVCVGLGSTRRGGQIAGGVLLALATAFKAIPVLLFAVAAWCRKWRFLASASAALVVLAIATFSIAPPSIFTGFPASANRLGGATATQSSIRYAVARMLGGSSVAGMSATALCVVIAAAMVWFGMRGVDDDTRWGVGYSAALVLTPIVWWHYLWVPIGAIALTLAGQRRLDDRLMAILPLVALATLPPSNPLNTSPGSSSSYQSAFLTACIVIVTVLASRTRRARALDDQGRSETLRTPSATSRQPSSVAPRNPSATNVNDSAVP
ncbi:MAG: DUF2029 domain-containing protein [Actinobacteria bacterium]|nr:DUF2029 domain-containing protein [Actinomycetota bacterium]